MGVVAGLSTPLDWLNRSAEGVICLRCGFVHTFMGDGHQFVEPEAVDPKDLPEDRPPQSVTHP